MLDTEQLCTTFLNARTATQKHKAEDTQTAVEPSVLFPSLLSSLLQSISRASSTPFQQPVAPLTRFQAADSGTEAGHTLSPAGRHATPTARGAHSHCSPPHQAWEQQDWLVVSVMVAIKPPWLPLQLCSSKQQVFPTRKSSRRVHASSTCMVGSCVNWYLLEMKDESKGGESDVHQAHRGHATHSHRCDVAQGAAACICTWLGGKKREAAVGERSNLDGSGKVEQEKVEAWQ